MPSGKSVLITGCADGGIGSAIAHAFADRGFTVFASSLSLSEMASLQQRSSVVLLKLDVTNSEQIEEAVKAVSGETGGRLDYLVNNAGCGRFMPLLDESIAAAKKIFDVNVWGALAVSQAFSPLLIAAKGVIVSNCSAAGYMNVPWIGIYASSKKSLQILSETLRLELKPFGVRVITIITGKVKSRGLSYFDNLKLPEGSRYKQIERQVVTVAQGKSEGVMEFELETSVYAETVVSWVLKPGQNGVLWGPGIMAGILGFITSWLPYWAQDKAWLTGSGLNEMTSR